MNQPSRSVEISIAAHYVPERVQFLALSLDAINSWLCCDVRITIVTNDLALAEDAALTCSLAKLAKAGRTVTFDQTKDLDHPWHLTWWHKQHLREWSAQANRNDLFCYIEDDIAISADAIAYFIKHLDSAKAQGLIPGFLRYENSSENTQISTDFLSHQPVGKGNLMHLAGTPFVPLEYPYWAGFVLDKELAVEYLQSPWSNIESADKQPKSIGHSCRVQSAWALTYHNVPPTMPSRMAVPVDDDLRPLKECLVWHTSNNYSESRTHGFGTIPIDLIFARNGFLVKAANMLLFGARLRVRILNKIARVFGLPA
ncbi:MAG: hypothetical protein ABJ239_00555 [Erythrobacter sp.]